MRGEFFTEKQKLYQYIDHFVRLPFDIFTILRSKMFLLFSRTEKCPKNRIWHSHQQWNEGTLERFSFFLSFFDFEINAKQVNLSTKSCISPCQSGIRLHGDELSFKIMFYDNTCSSIKKKKKKKKENRSYSLANIL